MTAFLQSWLFAWLFLLAITLGALVNLMVHALTGGRWGYVVQPALVAAARLMPFVALLFIPVLVGAARIYPWSAQPGHYLNVPFFVARAVAYLAIWVALAHAFLRTRSSRIAAGGLVVYAVTVSLAAVDWIASLTPHWYSSGFGLVIGTGQMLAGAALGAAAASFGARGTIDLELRERLHDLGNILLMYVLTWAYLAYTQFLVIWSENLPHEIAWYVPRMQTGWAAVGGFLIALHFALPLAILLSRAAKRSPAWLGWIAATLLAAHAMDALWLVMPSVRPRGFTLAWSDPVVFVVLVAAWAGLWRRAWPGEPALGAFHA
jgi:hypothetical protein